MSTEETTTETTTTAADTAAAGQLAALKAERTARQASEQALADYKAEIEAANKARDDEAAVKRGEFETLYGTAKTALEESQARVAAYETAAAERAERLTKANDKALKELPAAYRKLVPAGLSPEDKAEQIRAVAALAPKVAAGGIAGAGLNGSDEPIPQACKDEAALHKRDPRFWFDTVWKPRIARTSPK